jgi:mRNA-degrading endonuclease RelE of RelBE toxin-antitoxin system
MGELEGEHRRRVGDNRIRYRIDEEKKAVIPLDVGPRRSAYN